MTEERMKKTKGMSKWLMDNGHTEEEAQKEWEAAIAADVGGLVGWLHRNGYDWRYLALHQIPQLFGLAGRVIAKREEEAEKERHLREEQERKEKEEAYKNAHFDEYVLKKITIGESLSEDDLRKMRENLNEVDRSIYGDYGRWTRIVRSIFEIEGRYFALDWQEGLTEYQDDCFSDQPVEVVRHEYQKTITVVEWLDKEK